ncbi:kelch domain-containing protein 7A [Ambystoma mexicanum]|uniref:kelch domain-containing protein 7A n=1 Tax=Ambystoma mexicanum TaxID=8296 RepID=UPI0037E93E90
MINLSWETAYAQLDMALAGKLALSAAAAACLLALAFRFFQSRSADKGEPRAATPKDVRAAFIVNGKKAPQTGPTRSISEQAPGLRLRHIPCGATAPNLTKDELQAGCSDATITTETCRPSHAGHQSKVGEEDGPGASQSGVLHRNGQEELVGEGNLDHLNSEPADTMVILGGPEGSYLEQIPLNQVCSLAAVPSKQDELVVVSLAGEKSQASPCDTHQKPEPRLIHSFVHTKPSQAKNTRKDPEGEEMHRSLGFTEEAAATMEGEWTAKASSAMGLTINQSHCGVDRVYSFDSNAEVKAEESNIKGNPVEDILPAHIVPQRSSKGKLYHYFVEPTSGTVSKEGSVCSEFSRNHSSVLSNERKEPIYSPGTSYLTQNQEGQGSREDEAEPSSNEISPSPSHEGSMKSGSPSGTFLLVDSHQTLAKELVPQENSVMTDGLQQINNTQGLGLEMDLPSSSMRSSRSAGSSDGLGLYSIQSLPQSPHTSQDKLNTIPKAESESDLDACLGFLSSQPVSDLTLELGNCYPALKVAKAQQLVELKEAVYTFMSDNYLLVLQTPSIYGHLNATERELILERRMKGKRCLAVVDMDTQAHTPPSSRSSSRLCYYNEQGNSWHVMSFLPPEAVTSGCAVGTMFNYLFVVAGCEGPGMQRKPSNRVFCYNPLTDAWKEISPLNQARPHCKLVELQGYLYAIGGECQHTVEQYDPRRDRWNFATPLPNDTFAIAHMATVCEDKIYVTGGTLRYMLLSYDPREQAWKSSLISGSRDRTTEMVAATTFLYRFDLNRSMGISVHRCSVRARLWYECASRRMSYPASFQCAVIANRIHCLSRQFHIRFLADDVSPRFIDENLEGFPSPRGGLYPSVLVLPDKRVGRPGV